MKNNYTLNIPHDVFLKYINSKPDLVKYLENATHDDIIYFIKNGCNIPEICIKKHKSIDIFETILSSRSGPIHKRLKLFFDDPVYQNKRFIIIEKMSQEYCLDALINLTLDEQLFIVSIKHIQHISQKNTIFQEVIIYATLQNIKLPEWYK
jgi:hypothetical protein